MRLCSFTVKTGICTTLLVFALAGCGKKEKVEIAPSSPPVSPTQGAGVESVLAPAAPTESVTPPPPIPGANEQPTPASTTAAEKEEAIHPLSDRDVAMLNYAVGQFKQNMGRNPKSLQEMVSARFLPRIPQTVSGERLVYDPGSGRMKVEKIK